MKKKNLIRIVLILLIIINIGGIGYYVYMNFFNKNEPTNVSEEIKTIDKYVLYSNTNKLYRSTFDDLENKNDITNYTNTIAKLFIIDFYSLKYKITNTDVRGLQFINESIKENFKEKAINTIYKYVESNVYNDRDQKLPNVVNIEIVSNELIEYFYNDESINAYKIVLSWNYEEDLGYDTSKTLYLINQNNIYSIIEVS